MPGLSQMKLWLDLILGLVVAIVVKRVDSGRDSLRNDEMKRIRSGMIHSVASATMVIAVKQRRRV